MSEQFITAKIQGCANVSSHSIQSEGMQRRWRTHKVDNLKLANHTRIENAHKVRKQILFFIMWLLYVLLLRWKTDTGLCEPLWSIPLNCQ